ncbi:MAG: hypothetical protein ACHRXM_17730 [Isosphaerales bacterium]
MQLDPDLEDRERSSPDESENQQIDKSDQEAETRQHSEKQALAIGGLVVRQQFMEEKRSGVGKGQGKGNTVSGAPECTPALSPHGDDRVTGFIEVDGVGWHD